MNTKKILASAFALLICCEILSTPQIKEVFNLVVSAEDNIYTGYCGENATYSFDETTSTLTISGTGNMSFNSDTLFSPWYDCVIDMDNFINLAFQIKYIVIENGITSICAEAFVGCENVIDISIPNSVTFIGENAFNGCSSLKNINIPNSEAVLDNYVFYKCTSIEEVNLPSNLQTISASLFSYCENLKSIEIPNSVTTIEKHAFSNCTSLENIDLSNNLTTIEDKAFMNCKNLKKITIPNTVTNIGSQAFGGCYQLDNVIIPNSVTSIQSYAFSRCSNLYNITIPSSVTEIGISNSNDIYGIFDTATNPNITIYCESGSAIESYAIENGITYKDISETPNPTDEPKYNGTCGENATYSFDETTSTLTISGTGDMWKFSNLTFPFWHDYNDKITNVIVDDGITSIGSSCFMNCTSLTNITLPNSIMCIEDYAFHGCTALTEITIPSSVTSIGNFAFWDCKNLTKIIIPDSVIYIGNYVFNDYNKDFTIYGVKETQAERYATDNSFNFIAIEEEISPVKTKPTITDILNLKKYILGISENSTDLDFNHDNIINILDLNIAKQSL